VVGVLNRTSHVALTIVVKFTMTCCGASATFSRELGPKIVLVSTWRHDPANLEIADVVPDARPRSRGEEVREWLSTSEVGVRAGAPKPAISTVEVFKQTLLKAKSITYLPVPGVPQMLSRIGIADDIKSKTTIPNTDVVSELVAKGEVEVGIVVHHPNPYNAGSRAGRTTSTGDQGYNDVRGWDQRELTIALRSQRSAQVSAQRRSAQGYSQTRHGASPLIVLGHRRSRV
jgi:hypothetical protein